MQKANRGGGLANNDLPGKWATHTHTRLTALFPGLPGWAGTREVKPISISLKQETVSGSGISWAICKSAPRFRQITTPAPHHSVFFRPDALPAAQPTVWNHWRHIIGHAVNNAISKGLTQCVIVGFLVLFNLTISQFLVWCTHGHSVLH